MNACVEYIVSALDGYYPREEARELAYWIIEEETACSRTDVLTKDVGIDSVPRIEEILQRLRRYEPIQYIFGHTLWLGLDLRVTTHTLIPRPETAEMVEWVLQAFAQSDIRVADIGTGSGCIALALKKNRPDWEVTGIDINEAALQTACENGKRNKVQVLWKQADILKESIGFYDIVVSNPPYICEKEKAKMGKNVLCYEPQNALFVPDDKPLLFYERIAGMRCCKHLFFEINETYGMEVCRLLHDKGYRYIVCKNDMYGKQRMVYGCLDSKGGALLRQSGTLPC